MADGPKAWSPRNPERIEELRNRIERAVLFADMAFWKEIRNAFPETTSGDLMPDVAVEWNEAMDKVVYRWLSLNHPKSGWIEQIARE